jgi:uncharacterized lipoprotein YddW (UPF0748 family)
LLLLRCFSMANGTRRARWQKAPAGLFVLLALFAVTVSALADPPLSTLSDNDAPATENTVPVETTPPDAPVEMRGLWVVRDSLASPQSIRRTVETAVKYHFNAIFVQVRGRGDAWYDSPYEPRAEELARQPRSFDPLKMITEEAHAKGLRVHAWLNTYLTWSRSRRPYSAKHIWNAHRDWFALDKKGRLSTAPTYHCEGVFLQPSSPEVQQHLFNVFTHVATNYDVDGIHFDYCRYANSTYDYSGAALWRFRNYMIPQLTTEEIEKLDKRRAKDRLAYVHAFGNQWQQWRREQITGLIARISEAARAAKPDIEVSAAVFADADDAMHLRGQDWRTWLQAGYLDSVALMAYGKNTERIVAQTRHAVEAAGLVGRVYTGIGAWRLSAHDVAKKIEKIRKTGASGVNLFSYDGVHTRPEYLNTLRRGVFASRAASPRSRRLPPLPEKPEKSATAPAPSDAQSSERER